MLTVPLAIAGAVFSLWYFNQTLNIFSQIGMIMLVGLVTKNGILIVEFANKLREKGMSIKEAANLVIDSSMLAKGGEAIVSFPLVYPVHNDVAFDSLRFTETGVRRLAKYVGLTVKSINYRKTRTNSLVKYYSEDGMKMAKGMNHDITGYIVSLN
jgi:hypothetical protein